MPQDIAQGAVHPLLRNFLYGQYANLFKFALWWSALSPLIYSLLRSSEAIGVGRIVYNTAMCLLSPIGALLVERVHPRTILIRCALARFVVWCVLVPATWLCFDTLLIFDSRMTVYVLFNVFLFVDGVAVALSNILDIDIIGVDVVSNVFSLEVTDEHRNHFNTRQEFFFASCFVVFAPGMAFLGLLVHEGFNKTPNNYFTPQQSEAGTLTAIFFATFLIGTVLQIHFFRKLRESGNSSAGAVAPAAAPVVVASEVQPLSVQSSGGVAGTDGGVESMNAPMTPGGADGAPPSLWEQAKGVPADLLFALKTILSHRPIMFRLIFLGLEIAFEDAAIVVVAAQMGITLPWLGDNDAVRGNLWTAVGVAAGKLGGALASLGMMRFYKTPETPRQYVHVFALITASCVVMAAFPLITQGWSDGYLSDNAARALFLVSFFLYFFLSTLPKLGLMGLLQAMVSQVENGPRVFGFVAVIATTFDALVIMGLSVVFVHWELQTALWISAGVYLVHGILELIVGPVFVLMPMQRAHERPPTLQDATAGSGGAPNEASPLIEPLAMRSNATTTGSTPRLGEGSQATPITCSGPDLGGSFSVRGATVPIAVGDVQSGSSGVDVHTAVLSTSVHGVVVGSVNRRRSVLGGTADGADGEGTPGTARYARAASALGATPRRVSSLGGSPRSPHGFGTTPRTGTARSNAK